MNKGDFWAGIWNIVVIGRALEPLDNADQAQEIVGLIWRPIYGYCQLIC